MTWDGAFAPIRKHRDFKHKTFFEHLLANGVAHEVAGEPVWCDINPITDEQMSRSRPYYLIIFWISRRAYPYLIPTDDKSTPPTEEEIKAAMERYCDIDIPRGRDINNCIDFERGIPSVCIQFMRDNGLGDKVDFRWTDNERP